MRGNEKLKGYLDQQFRDVYGENIEQGGQAILDKMHELVDVSYEAGYKEALRDFVGMSQ